MHVPVLTLIILGDEINVKKEKQRSAFFHLASPESPRKMKKKGVTQDKPTVSHIRREKGNSKREAL